jgi:hypothetical protein
MFKLTDYLAAAAADGASARGRLFAKPSRCAGCYAKKIGPVTALEKASQAAPAVPDTPAAAMPRLLIWHPTQPGPPAGDAAALVPAAMIVAVEVGIADPRDRRLDP